MYLTSIIGEHYLQDYDQLVSGLVRFQFMFFLNVDKIVGKALKQSSAQPERMRSGSFFGMLQRGSLYE